MGSMGSGVDIDMLTVGFLKVNRYVEYLEWQQLRTDTAVERQSPLGSFAA